jgi:hypothetical protein
MHFRLPTPLHGWREFAGEVGIIVLGVLIALGFGQIAEALHDRWNAAEARDAIRAEVRENLSWLEVRDDYEPCINGMLSDLDSVLARARNGQATPRLANVGLPVHSKITSIRWDANAQAGRASLFSGDEQRNLGNMYFTTEEFRASQEQEETVWGKLGFVNGLNRFTPLDVHELSILLAEAHYRNFRAQLDILRGHQWAGRLHLTAANPDSVEKMAHAKKIDCPALVEGDPKR